MKECNVLVRFSSRILLLVLLAPLAATAGALASAQQPAAAKPAASTGQAVSAQNQRAEEVTPKSERREEDSFLYAPVVQSIAKKVHLSVETTSNIFQGINFAVIFLAIAIPLFRFLPRMLRNRSRTILHNLESARKVTEDANTRLAAVETRLSGLDKEIAALRAQVEQDSLQDEVRIKAAFEQESARVIASAEQEIEVAALHARRALQTFAADLAIDQAARQMVLTPEADQALIAEFIRGAASGSGKGGQN